MLSEIYNVDRKHKFDIYILEILVDFQILCIKFLKAFLNDSFYNVKHIVILFQDLSSRVSFLIQVEQLQHVADLQHITDECCYFPEQKIERVHN